MNDIVVVGCGNIGSRLIQSLSNIDPKICGKMRITGLEPFPAAWPTAQARFAEENKGGHSLKMIETPKDLPSQADLIVFAMDARNRLAAMTDVLAVCRPKNILLEKILFTKPADYALANALVDDCGAKCWVNTSRNIWPGYQALKTKLEGKKITEFTVAGSDWGLACNAIHFLSAFECISGEKLKTLDIDLKTALVNASKRAGYKELTGTLSGVSPSGAKVTVSSLAEANVPITVKVNTEIGNFLIHEGKTIVDVANPAQESPFGLFYTSQLHGMFEKILTTGTSDLPTLEQSTHLHRLLLKALNEVFHGEASLAYECPIT